MHARLFLLVIATGFLASGCALTPQSASVNPDIVISSENLGNSATIAFRVLDERPSQSLGNRGAAMISKGAEIKAKEDVAAVLHEKISDGLKQKGFQVAPYSNDAPLRMTVELREFNYSTSTGFWTGGAKVVATVKVIAARNGRDFEQMYRSDNEKRVVFVPNAKANEDQLSEAMRDIVVSVFADYGLMTHLSGK